MDKELRIDYEGILATVKALKQDLKDSDWSEAIDTINTIGSCLEDLRVELEDRHDQEEAGPNGV